MIHIFCCKGIIDIFTFGQKLLDSSEGPDSIKIFTGIFFPAYHAMSRRTSGPDYHVKFLSLSPDKTLTTRPTPTSKDGGATGYSFITTIIRPTEQRPSFDPVLIVLPMRDLDPSFFFCCVCVCVCGYIQKKHT